MQIALRTIKAFLILSTAGLIFFASFCVTSSISANRLFETNPPTNPSDCTEDHGVTNGTWQNTVNDPSFTWLPGNNSESGVDGYLIYWGTDPNGVSVNYQQLITTYDPPAVSTGIYYLRVNTRDVDGNEAGWVTLFTFQFDASPPSMTAIEIGGSTNDVWQNTITTPVFSLTPSEVGIGFDGYYLYWGNDPNGSSSDPIIRGVFSYSPGFQADGVYYLRINSIDLLSNASGWVTVYIFRLDTLNPDPVTTVTELNGFIPATWHNLPTPSFNWNNPTGASKYNIYWGPDPLSTIATAFGINPPATVTASPGVNNYLRVQSVDSAGNTSSWSSVLFTYWFDNTPPSAVTTVTETANGIISGECTILRDATITWDASTVTGAPLAGYYYYWGTDPIGINTGDRVPAPPLYLNLPKGDKYYLRMAAFDDAGNVSDWNTNFILCNGDVVKLVSAASGNSITLGVPNSIVGASFSFPPNAYQVFEDPNWVGKDFWVRLWYPTFNSHRDPPPGKVTPYTHQSFNLAADLATDSSSLFELTLPFTVTLSYSEDSILALYENSLAIYRWNGDQWKALSNSTVDTLNNTVTGLTYFPGEFLLLGDPLPSSDLLSINVNSISFGSFMLTGKQQILEGITLPWEILDATYTNSGWQVLIRATDFIDPEEHTIPVQNLSMELPQSNVTTLIGNNIPESAIPSQTDLSINDQLLISATRGASSGKFSIQPKFFMDIPPDVYSGNYSNTVTVTIVAGPN